MIKLNIKRGLLILAMLLTAFSLSLGHNTAQGQDEVAKCAICHDKEESEKNLRHLDFYVDFKAYLNSVHGEFNCTVCHQSHSENPHKRDMDNLDQSIVALAKELQPLKTKDTYALATCTICHYTAFEQFRTSIHGTELFQNKNRDVAYCPGCHSSPHYIKPGTDPTSATYYANIPAMCGRCHGDSEIISKYNLNSHVLQGYDESFHGKKLILGSSRVAVCTSCHGAHAIISPKNSQQFQSQLSSVCGRCHQGATVKFAQAFTHIPVSELQTRIIYWTEQFFALLLIVVMVSLVGHVALDIAANVRESSRERKVK